MGWIPGACVGLLGGAALALLRRRGPPWPPETLALRAGIVVCAALAAAGLEAHTGAVGRARVVLLDRSRSVQTARAQLTRAVSAGRSDLGPNDRVALVLVGAEPVLAHGWLDPAGASAAAARALANPVDPWGSDLGAGVRLAADLLARQSRPGELILLSDGRDTGGTLDAAAAQLSGVPVHVWLPDAPPPAGARLLRLDAPPRPSPAEGVAVRVEAQALSEGLLRVELELRPEGQAPIALEAFERSARKGERVTRTWMTPPLPQGAVVLAARVRAAGRDDAPEDDLRELQILVGGGPRVLSVGVASGLQATRVPAEGLARALSTPADLVILSEVPAQRLTDQVQALRAAVRSGTGLIVLGASSAFGPGGYAGHSLESLLPVTSGPGNEREQGLALAVALDASGSMAQPAGRSRYLQALEAALPLSVLGDKDRLAVVTFAETAERFAPLGPTPPDLLTRLAEREPRGPTDIAAGLVAALDELSRAEPDADALLILATDSEDASRDGHARVRALAQRLAGREARALLVHIGPGPMTTLAQLASALRPHLEVTVERAADASDALRELVEGELLAARSQLRSGSFRCLPNAASTALGLSVPAQVSAFAPVRARTEPAYAAQPLGAIDDEQTQRPPLAVLGRYGLGQTLALPLLPSEGAPLLAALAPRLTGSQGEATLLASRDGADLRLDLRGSDLGLDVTVRLADAQGRIHEVPLTPLTRTHLRARVPAPSAGRLHGVALGAAGTPLASATVDGTQDSELSGVAFDPGRLPQLASASGGSILAGLPSSKRPLPPPAQSEHASAPLAPLAAFLLLLLVLADAASATLRARVAREG